MPTATITISDVEDMAPSFGVETMTCRPVRDQLGAEAIGLTEYIVKPNARVGFGHDHTDVEEMYLITAGDGRFKLDDEIVDVSAGQVVYCSPDVTREWEGGDDGMTVIAFGSHVEGDGNMQPGWWTD